MMYAVPNHIFNIVRVWLHDQDRLSPSRWLGWNVDVDKDVFTVISLGFYLGIKLPFRFICCIRRFNLLIVHW